MKTQLLAKLDLMIIQDWDLIRNLTYNDPTMMQKSVNLNTIMLDHGDGHAVAYMGSLSEDWAIFSGNLLNDAMPWYKNFLEIIEPLQYDGCGFQKHRKSITEHADIRACHSDSEKSHGLEPDRQCKINYVVSSDDPDAVTIVTDRDDPTNISKYGSTPNGAWLLNINHPHYLKCNGYREVLSFKFCEKFETVLEHFNKLGPLTLK